MDPRLFQRLLSGFSAIRSGATSESRRRQHVRGTRGEQEFVPSQVLFVPAPARAAGLHSKKSLCCNDFNGERGGTRTLDPMIKSHVLMNRELAPGCPNGLT